MTSDETWSGLWNGLLGQEQELAFDKTTQDLTIPALNLERASLEDFDGPSIESWYHSTFPLLDINHVVDAAPEPQVDDSIASVEQDTCYGMLHRVAVKLQGDGLTIDQGLVSTLQRAGNGFQELVLGISSHDVDVRLSDGTSFGLLNRHTAESVSGLLQKPELILQGSARISELRENLARALKASTTVVRIDIIIYGPKEMADEVGRELSRHKSFLQRPTPQKADTSYSNPHLLLIPGFEEDHRTLATDDNQLRRKRGLGLDDASLTTAIADLYASLTRGKDLDRQESSSLVETKLLEHQKEALHFMMQREDGPVPEQYKLWKPQSGPDTGWYRHVITRQRKRQPPAETGGGILADEMGMGKTLSILALTMQTFDDAQNWASHTSSSDEASSDALQTRCAATLVVVPSAWLINEWKQEITKHLNSQITVLVYHGKHRVSIADRLMNADIVITTYHTLVSDYKKRNRLVLDLTWYRTVLDEAHIIRRQSTVLNRVVSAISSRSRWCLSGTPIQNRLDDIGTLFAFAQIQPFHSLATFRRFISTPFDESKTQRQNALQNLGLLLEATVLRRSTAVLHLPEPHSVTQTITLSTDERRCYDQLKVAMDKRMRDHVGHEPSQYRFGLFQIELHLRIFCNHGTYQRPFHWARSNILDAQEAALQAMGPSAEVRCSVCREDVSLLDTNSMNDLVGSACAHIMCAECKAEVTMRRKPGIATQCPVCSVAQDLDSGAYFETTGISSKMHSLTSDVLEGLSQYKTIVFTGWTHTLDLIELHFDRSKIPFRRIDGKSAVSKRQKIVGDFTRSNTVPVLIMTLGVGAFGLNLASVNRIFLLEPQWNPSVESQAIARAQRLGQSRTVTVVRYVVQDTVEQDILAQQQRKLQMAKISAREEAGDMGS